MQSLLSIFREVLDPRDFNDGHSCHCLQSLGLTMVWTGWQADLVRSADLVGTDRVIEQPGRTKLWL